uniref:hematopoietic prostaglandin D synthase-like n=1 Tax=Styela clava TaxID=7725 RepID=UPI00193A8B65|nr:hematopoietic prostaglandin D synthase-like [Styela clava]
MVVYKLTYFNIMGRAELTRVMFAQAGVKYEDVRLTPEEWGKMKPSSVFGQLPMLEVDGVQYCQSPAINSYLSKKFGFSGKTEEERMRVEMIGFCIHDMAMKIPYMEKDEQKRKEGFERAFKEDVPPLLQKLEALIKQNKNGDGYFVGELSSADMGWMLMADYFKLKCPDLLKAVPKLAALAKKVAAEPKISAWIKSRPKTEM